ncbi:MAG: septal ring lytic transglycosylase RlpA family protein [Devosia sp.]
MIKHIVVAALLVTGCCSFVTGDSFAGDNQCGGASWYSLPGQKTASGERMNPNAMTAAHKTLPLGSVVKVVDQRSGRSVRVTINDRGPYVRGRIIDLSRAAARQLGIIPSGVGSVCLVRV